MSHLQWTDTPSGIQILSRQDRLLCSPRNPFKEAEEWVERNKNLIQAATHLGVVGAGSGIHIQVLEKNYPNKNICVFELDPDFSKIEKKFQSQLIIGNDPALIRENQKEFFQNWPVIIPFRPAFQPMDAAYVEFWMGLAQRTQVTTDKLLKGSGYISAHEEKIWTCLRELVK